MSWFNEVTGTNDYERQSWRDSYNGGRAAGDLTGATNARLDAERAAFQGATWSGSSSQLSAIELAQSMGGPGFASGNAGASGNGGGGPASEVVTQGPAPVAAPKGGSGPASRLTISGPLTSKFKDTATGGYAGLKFHPNPWFSDVQEWWEPRFGEPGEWLGGIVNIGADGVFNTGRFIDWASGSDIVSGARKDRHVSLAEQTAQPGAWPAISEAFGRQANMWDRQLHDVFAPGRPYVGGGF